MGTGGGTKGKSPFYPGQPVPIELFVGRTAEVERIMQRGAGQVAAGKPVSVFIQGDNFLQEMKRLKVLRSGEVRGKYIFNLRMVRLYIWLQSHPAQRTLDSSQ